MYTPVTVTQFKGFFVRDFPYGTNPNENILDADITKALATAGDTFNEGLWSSQAQFERAYLYLSAHYLVESIKASGQGISSQYGGNTTSKSVGNVSESYEIPDKVKNNPFFAGLYTTRYGAIYVGMLQPRIIGNVTLLRGMTTP
jgi:hypothetical protein